MLGLGSIEVIIFKDVQKGKHTAIDPSPPLFHQILVTLHWISSSSSIWHIFQIEFAIWLTVDA